MLYSSMSRIVNNDVVEKDGVAKFEVEMRSNRYYLQVWSLTTPPRRGGHRELKSPFLVNETNRHVKSQFDVMELEI